MNRFDEVLEKMQSEYTVLEGVLSEVNESLKSDPSNQELLSIFLTIAEALKKNIYAQMSFCDNYASKDIIDYLMGNLQAKERALVDAVYQTEGELGVATDIPFEDPFGIKETKQAEDYISPFGR